MKFVKEHKNLIIHGAAILFAVVALLVALAPAVVLNINGSSNLSFYQLAFGSDYTDPVAGSLVAFIFAIVGIVASGAACGLPFLMKDTKKFDLLAGVVASLFLVTTGILFFCSVAFLGETLFGYSLGVGAILGGIFMLLAGLLECGFVALAVLKK